MLNIFHSIGILSDNDYIKTVAFFSLVISAIYNTTIVIRKSITYDSKYKKVRLTELGLKLYVLISGIIIPITIFIFTWGNSYSFWWYAFNVIAIYLLFNFIILILMILAVRKLVKGLADVSKEAIKKSE